MKYFLTITVLGLILCANFIPYTVLAQKATEYSLLAPLPGVETAEGSGVSTASSYIPGLFKLLIAIAGALAVVKIIFGGIQYMSTDAFTGKNEAKTTIENAIWGLILAISAWLILYTINPKLVEFNLSIPVQQIATSTVPVIGGQTSGQNTCNGCINLTAVPAKLPMINPTECGRNNGCGCAYHGPCQVQRELNARLIVLKGKDSSLFVNEAYPPTVPHKEACHNDGTCVDATISSLTPQNIKKFMDNANGSGLTNTIFEAANQGRVNAIVLAGGPASQVIITDGNGEHFHIRLR